MNAADTSIISLDNFSLEDLPMKAILVDPKATEDTHLIVYHSGNNFFLLIIEFRGAISLEKDYHRFCQETLQGAR